MQEKLLSRVDSQVAGLSADLLAADLLVMALQKTLPNGRLLATRLTLVPEIALRLFDPAVLEGPIPSEVAQAVMAEPAYWSFCWASGQVLARFILDHPHYAAGKTVVDVGSGSGVVAIAAALAGAGKAIAVDIDPVSRQAVEDNAKLNRVTIDVRAALPSELNIELLTAADILYDRENLALLPEFRQQAAQVLLADSRVKNLNEEGYTKLAVAEARTCPDLNEFEEFNQVRIYLAE